VKKTLILIIFFYVLALLQTSFLVHFHILGIVPNFIFIAVILINLFEKPQKNSGILSAFIGGFFLDIFSSRFIGFNILILVGLSFFIKFILKKYVQFSLQNYEIFRKLRKIRR